MSNEKEIHAISHALLAGTGIYCLYEVKDHNFFAPHVTFGVIAIHNILAAVRSFDESLLNNNITDITALCQLLFALPCITSRVYEIENYKKEICYAWALVPIIPLALVLSGTGDPKITDLMLVASEIGLGIASAIDENYEGVGAAVIYAVTAHGLGDEGVDIKNVALILFCYCSLKAIGIDPSF